MKLVFSQRIRQIIAVCIVLTMLVGMINGQGYLTFAYEAQSGMIYTTGSSLVNTRKEPSDDAEKVRGFEYGKNVTVVDEVTDANGDLWYLITYVVKATGTTESSYCRAENVLIDKVFATGVLNATNVSLRDYAGTEGTNILISLNTGDKVELLYETIVDSKLWYRVRYTAPATVDAATGETIPGQVYIGWMRERYINITEYNIDAEYKQQLMEAGFPESYANSLAVLHARYPEWIFEPVMTGLSWQAVIDGETLKADGSSNPINMVTISSDDAMKSVHEDDYDWNTNTWVIRDGNSWVAVHPEYLAYIMDPRNFLTEEYIFQFESLSYSESHTIEGVNAVIGSSFMANDAVDSDGTMFNYATAFMSIGKEVGVSPYHLVSRVRQEQGSKGTSSLISGTYSGYEGYYNYFNFGAHGITETAVIEAGLKYAKNQGWDTRYKALCGGAEKIAKNYIARGQDTLYFQKFNVVWKDMLYGHQYMGAVLAPTSEAKSIAKAYTDKHQAFVFRIPVYENMPEEAVQFTASGNRNNYLSDITVEGLSLSPTFTGANKEYTLTVGNSISSINVNATPVVSKSTVTGTGVHKLEVGENIIKILCVSESGDERIYTLTVVREEYVENPDGPDPDEPGTDEPGTDEPGTNEPGTDEPGTDNPGDEPTDPPSGSETPTYTYTDLNQTMYVISSVNVRDLPAKEGNSLGILSDDQEVTVTGQCNETGWYRITYGSKVGYVSNKYLTTEKPEPEIPANISSQVYIIGKYITGIQPGTTAEDFLNGITRHGGAEVKLLDKNGSQKTGTVGTGNVLAVYGNGELVASYEIVIYGDVSGDGKVNTLDAIKLNRYTIGLVTLSGAYLEAANASRDSRVNTLDSIVINRYSIGLVTINQN
ncbi:MAG: SH3 domain-containing protein [Agathobacter sp.]|nr:SH3 domain-containing protein [Agathobacter sp.]